MSSFDPYFQSVTTLKWLPWVGDRYGSLPSDSKMLIVGESHYHDRSETSISNHNSPTLTREVIDEMAIERCYYGTKIFPNFHKALMGNDEFDSQKFWHLLSFYNFVQRPMDTNRERPQYDDYYSAWGTFIEITKILKPKRCIFIGTTAANSLAHAIQDLKMHHSGVVWEDFISNAYAKTACIKLEDFDLEIIFIRHSSQMFSWSQWNKYLLKKIPGEIRWLQEQIKSN